VRAPIKRLSLCPCGHPVLDESIPLGTVYEIGMDSIGPGTLKCGGCGRVRGVQLVLCSQKLHPDRPMAPLPVEIFMEHDRMGT
jgi:hypothetical protein